MQYSNEENFLKWPLSKMLLLWCAVLRQCVLLLCYVIVVFLVPNIKLLQAIGFLLTSEDLFCGKRKKIISNPTLNAWVLISTTSNFSGLWRYAFILANTLPPSLKYIVSSHDGMTAPAIMTRNVACLLVQKYHFDQYLILLLLHNIHITYIKNTYFFSMTDEKVS